MINFFKKIFRLNKNLLSSENNECKEYTSAIFYALDGEIALKTGDYLKAVENMTKAIELEDNNDMFYYTRALAYKALKDYKSALVDINQALKINGNINQTILLKEELTALINN